MVRAVRASVLVLCCLPGAVLAALVPTQVNTGDCVADRIVIPHALERQPFDQQYCRRWNPGDAAAAAVCLRNSALSDTAFFTDRCGDGSEFYLAVDGVEHVLRRVGPPWSGVNLSGRFAGNELELEILPLRKLERGDPAPEQADPEQAESGSGTVRVTLARGGERRIFEATLDYGP